MQTDAKQRERMERASVGARRALAGPTGGQFRSDDLLTEELEAFRDEVTPPAVLALLADVKEAGRERDEARAAIQKFVEAPNQFCAQCPVCDDEPDCPANRERLTVAECDAKRKAWAYPGEPPVPEPVFDRTARPIAEILAEIGAAVPAAEWARVPRDLSGHPPGHDEDQEAGQPPAPEVTPCAE